MADEIKELLESYHANTLWEIADAAGLAVTTPEGKRLTKAQVVRKMQAEFFTEERVHDALQKLDERERAILNRLQVRGGSASKDSFRRELARVDLVSSASSPADPRRRRYPSASYGRRGNPHDKNSRLFVDVMARLTYLGLVFSQDAPKSTGSTRLKLQYEPGETVFIPAAIARYLPDPEPVPQGLPDLQPDRVSGGEPDLLLRDLYLYWDFVRRNEVPQLKTGLVGKRSLKAINEVLLVPDPLLADARREDDTERLHLLRRLLEELDLVHMHRGALRPTQPDPVHVPEFWTWPLSQQVGACLDAWSQLAETKAWHKDAASYYPRFAHARQQVLNVLQTLASGVWFALEDLLDRVQERDTNFLFAERSEVNEYRGSWYYSYSSYSYYGAPKELRKEFDEYEERFVRDALSGVLQQLGLVELGYQGQQLRAFRLTPGGEAMLAGKGAKGAVRSLQEAPGKVIVQPNFQAMALGPVSLGWLARLDLFAERQGADRGAFEYRLTRNSVYEAQQLGVEVDEVARFLEEASGAELPQNVRRSLQEWGASHERIVFRTGVDLLQAARPELLDDLLQEDKIAKQVVRAVSPGVVLLKKDGQRPLITSLLERGLLPAVSGPEPEAADASVIVEADGRIRSIHEVPGLHLRGRLSRLAEADGEGQWRLTPESVRRAGGSKARMNRVLEELSRLHRGSLPQGLAEKLKAWGGYFGSARAETLTLIQFRDQDTLRELMEHPELGSLLTPFAADKRALAVVPTDRLDEVKEILDGLGVQVRSGLSR